MSEDFNDDLITKNILGKTIKRFVRVDHYSDQWMELHFADGAVLRIRYDWLYEWEMIEAEPVVRATRSLAKTPIRPLEEAEPSGGPPGPPERVIP